MTEGAIFIIPPVSCPKLLPISGLPLLPAIDIVLVTCSGPGALGNAEKNLSHTHTQGTVGRAHTESAKRVWIW